MLRAVGMTRPQARRMIRHESIITVLIGAALGIPLGVFLSLLLAQALSQYDVQFSVPVVTLAVFACVAIVAGCSGRSSPRAGPRGSTCSRRSSTGDDEHAEEAPEHFCYLRREVRGIFHPTSTCAIGAVVDPRGAVLGVDGLLVADASIMPTIPRANTNLSTIAIAERIADWLSI
jgi:choline dehydrogenase-like flavoprotein